MKKDYNNREMLKPLTEKEMRLLQRNQGVDLMFNENSRDKIKLIERIFG